MKKRIILSPLEFEKVPLEWIRIYADMLIKEIPEYSKGFQDGDQYRIFFPKNAYTDFETRERIHLFKKGVMVALHETFGVKILMDDMALIFRYKQGTNSSVKTSKIRTREMALANFLRKKLEVIIANSEISYLGSLKIPEGYTLITPIINKEETRMLVPNEYLEFSELLYVALSEEPDIGFSKEVIRSRNRKMEIIKARTIFIFVFTRKFPDVTFKFLTYLLNYENHSTVIHLYSKVYTMLDPVNINGSNSQEFFSLVDKIKTRCGTM